MNFRFRNREGLIKFYEAKQRAIAKYQQEERDKGVKEILSLPISNNEKLVKINELYRKLELDVYKKFNPK